MDIVYILGKGSLSNDDELRLSLRSVQAYCEDLGNIYIVGECPEWLTEVTHIPFQQTHKKPWKNVHDMVRVACLDDRITDEFLLMNDDFFSFAPFTIESMPFYANKAGNGGASGPIDFAVHRPIRIKKQFYLNLPISTEMTASISPRTFYCNFLKCPPTYCKDVILRVGENMAPLDKQLGMEPWASIDDITMTTDEFKQFMVCLYEQESTYEATSSSSLFFDINKG